MPATPTSPTNATNAATLEATKTLKKREFLNLEQNARNVMVAPHNLGLESSQTHPSGNNISLTELKGVAGQTQFQIFFAIMMCFLWQ
jgi:hypothetical protein